MRSGSQGRKVLPPSTHLCERSPHRSITIAETGERIKVASHVVFFGADNSNGHGDSSGNFAGVREQNTAFLDRFLIHSEVRLSAAHPGVWSGLSPHRSEPQGQRDLGRVCEMWPVRKPVPVFLLSPLPASVVRMGQGCEAWHPCPNRFHQCNCQQVSRRLRK
jgi:hypothetical protein